MTPDAQKHSTVVDEATWQRALDWLLQLNDRPDDAELRAAFEAWRLEHPAHAQAYEQAQTVWAATGRLDQLAHTPSRRWPARRTRLSAAAAVMVIAIAATAAGPTLWQAWLADYRTAAGERQAVTLADGSRLTLGSSSAIDVAFDDRRRRIDLLSGRAYAEVEPEAGRPFTITAGAIQTRVLGTRYGVGWQQDQVEVQVAEGRVAVRGGPESIALSAGQTARLPADGGSAQIASVQPHNVAAWRRGLLIVDDWTVAQVMRRLDTSFPGRIWVNNDDLAQRRVSGVLQLDDPMAAARAAVQPHAGQVTAYPWLLLIR